MIPLTPFVLALLLLLGACGAGPAGTGAPVVTITASPTSGVPPLAVTFTVNTSDPDGTVVKTEADLDGDGVFELDMTGQTTATFTYATAGVFKVKVRATDNDGLTTTAALEIFVADRGDILKTLPFPAGITTVFDVAFVGGSNTFFLVGSAGTSQKTLVEIDADTGAVVFRRLLSGIPFFTNNIGEITWDGSFLWMTADSGFSFSTIFRVSPFGDIILTIPCPAAFIGSCSGLGWDGGALWLGASGNHNIARMSIFGGLLDVFTGPGTGSGTEDVAYDSARGHLIVRSIFPDTLWRVDPATRAVVDSLPLPATMRKGDWDGRLFWFVNNASNRLEGVFID